MPPALEHAHAAPPTFDEVYEGYFNYVFRTLRRLGVPDRLVDDAVQDTFVVVHRRLADFEGRSTVKTWVFGIALRVARDVRRALRRRGRTAPLPKHLADPGPDPENSAEQREALALLDRLLAELDDDKREVFVLSDIEQLTGPEIAEVLEIKLNTVYSRLRVARQEFSKATARNRAREEWRTR